MKKFFYSVLICFIVLIYLCIKKNETNNFFSETISNENIVIDSSIQENNFKINVNDIQKEFIYLQDKKITKLGYLVKAIWNEEGDGFKIYCLNDIAEYEGDMIFEFKFESDIFKQMNFNKSNRYVVDDFINSINDRLNEADVMIELEVNNLVIITRFYEGGEIIFNGYKDEFLKSNKIK